MRKRIFTGMMVMATYWCNAQNPIIQNVFTADPAPLVYKDTLFLFTGHDEDSATSKGFIMDDYLCFSTTDMVNWTQHGSVFSTPSLGWAAKHNANAAQVVGRNGKFYYYVSPWSALKDGGDCIAVGIADKPTGPYKDALGKPLINPSDTKYRGHLWEDIDPTILIDDDGQAYMYWGNNALYAVKLNKDMISYSGEIKTFNIKDTAAFGPDYEEAPWIFKRNNLYYLMYAAFVPEHIYYAISTSPLGPWKYGGIIMDAKAQGSIGNHPGVIQYKGNWYFFYMNEDLPNGHDKRRAVNVIPFTFNADGSISKLSHSKEGVTKPIKNLNPYQKTEAETMAWEEGIETTPDNKSGMYVTDIDNNDYIKVRSADFGKGATNFHANLAATADGGLIEIRLDSLTGTLAGTLQVKPTGSLNNWQTQTCKIKNIRGKHDVFFVFRGTGSNLFNFNWWYFGNK